MFTTNNRDNDTPEQSIWKKQLNVLAIGDEGAGVSSWMCRATYETFRQPTDYISTVNFKNINSTDRIAIWLDPFGRECRFYKYLPSSLLDLGFRRAQPSAIVIILDLTLDQELLKTQVFNHKKRYGIYMKPGTLVYFVGTKQIY